MSTTTQSNTTTYFTRHHYSFSRFACTTWQTIHSLTSSHLSLFTTLNIHHKTKQTLLSAWLSGFNIVCFRRFTRSTRLQQPTSPDITTASADLHVLLGRPSTRSHPVTYLYSLSSVYITRPKQLTFTSLKQQQTTKKPIGHHLNNMLRISFPADPTA